MFDVARDTVDQSRLVQEVRGAPSETFDSKYLIPLSSSHRTRWVDERNSHRMSVR